MKKQPFAKSAGRVFWIPLILGPKKVKVLVPLYTVLTLFLLNSVFFFLSHNAVGFPQKFRSYKLATTHSLLFQLLTNGDFYCV